MKMRAGCANPGAREHRSAWAVAALGAAVATAAAAAEPPLVLSKVAEIGDPAPGLEQEGLLFEGFGEVPFLAQTFGDPPPAIDREGNVTFHAFLGADGIPNTQQPFGQTALYRQSSGALELIVRVGDPAPGTGSVFLGFPGPAFFPAAATPEIELGRLAFFATAADDSNQNGVWSNRFGDLDLVVRTSDAMPGPTPDPLFILQFASAFRGQTVMVNAITALPNGEQQEGLWRDSSGAFELIATDGAPAPGTEPGVVFGTGTSLAFFGCLDAWNFDVHGNAVFDAYLAAVPAVCGNGVCETASDEDCLSCTQDCNGQQTGNPNDRFCCGDAGENPVNCGDPRCSTGGFECDGVSLPDVNVDNDEGIWADGPGGLELIVREGDSAPQAGANHLFGSGGNGELGGLSTFGNDQAPPHRNDNGAVLFGARITSPDFYVKDSIWTTRNGQLELVVTASSGLAEEPGGPFNQFPGDPAPGLEALDATFRNFFFAELSNEGRIAFIGNVILNDDPLSVRRGIWWDGPGELTLAAASGLSLPGLDGQPVSTVFYKVNAFNDWDHVFFFAVLPGEGDPGFRPLFRANPDGTVDLVLRVGDGVLVDGVSRTVASFEMGDGLSTEGRGIFEVTFTDGSNGVYTARIVPAAGPPGDIDGDGTVGIIDLLALLAAWGPCLGPPVCPADLDDDGSVGITDLLILLANWTS